MNTQINKPNLFRFSLSVITNAVVFGGFLALLIGLVYLAGFAAESFQ